jgi:hypothetical protein
MIASKERAERRQRKPFAGKLLEETGRSEHSKHAVQRVLVRIDRAGQSIDRCRLRSEMIGDTERSHYVDPLSDPRAGEQVAHRNHASHAHRRETAPQPIGEAPQIQWALGEGCGDDAGEAWPDGDTLGDGCGEVGELAGDAAGALAPDASGDGAALPVVACGDGARVGTVIGCSVGTAVRSGSGTGAGGGVPCEPRSDGPYVAAVFDSVCAVRRPSPYAYSA